jgi:hypothetical protein
MGQVRQKITLDQPVVYQIKVQGQLDASWSDWVENSTMVVESVGNGLQVSTLTCLMDQAKLHGFLRQLYALGLPLISVICIEG